MRTIKCIFVAMFCFGLTSQGRASIYWVDYDTHNIQRATEGGALVTDFITNVNPPSNGLTIDPIGGYIYWMDKHNGKNTIDRANLVNGGGRTTIVEDTNGIGGIAVDSTNGFLFWASWSSDIYTATIMRANLDGSGAIPIINSASNVKDIVADPTNGIIYWSDWGTNRIRRAGLDGTLATTVTTTTDPGELFIDSQHGHVYWSGPRIGRANLDGTGGVTEIVPSPTYGMAVDLNQGYVFWTIASGQGPNPQSVWRSDLLGNNAVKIVSAPNGVGTPGFIRTDAVTVPEPSGFALALAASCLVAIRRWKR